METYPYVAVVEKENKSIYSVTAEAPQGTIVAIFSGPRARTRALEYAHLKFSDVVDEL